MIQADDPQLALCFLQTDQLLERKQFDFERCFSKRFDIQKVYLPYLLRPQLMQTHEISLVYVAS